MLRRTLISVALLLGLVLALGSYAVHRLRSGPPIRSQSLTVSGLQESVEIVYDSMGVPHIFAESMEDAIFAQGYVHARDRLWQMERFRRVLQGRLSEILGPSMVDTDRFLRTLGLERAARDGLSPSGSPTRRLMDHYAAGVNAAIDGWSGLLPPEFVLLRFQPEPWEPYMSQGMEKIMAWDLSDYHTGLNLALAREALGDSAIIPLLPSYPEWGVTIVDGWPDGPTAETASAEPAGGGAGPGAGMAALPPGVDRETLLSARLSDDVARVLEAGSVVRASNSWVVGGERSRSGKPLLANDMHLALDAPNIWYLVGLHAPGVDVVGMSLPGAPGVVAGHSAAVAWGFTNAMVDDSDFFIEEIHPEDPARYRTPDGWAEFETRTEIIRIKGEQPVELVVRSTHHGPVISEVDSRAGDHVLAFSWVAHEPSGTFDALIRANSASSVDELLSGLREFNNPHQNVVFADTAGDWGYWMGGRVPLRATGLPPHLPVPGWTGESDWVGWLPFEEKPHVLAPARGYIATANHAQVADSSALRVTDGNWAGPYRGQRISELIEARPLHDAQSMLAIQMDAGSAFVDRYLPFAVQAFRDAGLTDLADRLEAWDRAADLESTEATLFHTWWVGLRSDFMEHYYDGDRGYFPGSLVGRALEGDPTLPARATLPPEFPVEAARRAAAFADLPWGEAHRLALNHPMGQVPVVGSLLRFGRADIPRVGGPNSVNVAGFSGTTPPFVTTYGPSQRHVVDMGDLDGAGGFILPGGQSGYPASPHSFDQLELWNQGRLWRLPLARGAVEARSVATVRLTPGTP
jgi:penicillin amidase